MKLVVLASGRGSNFAAIADAIARGEIPSSQILALICNKPGAAVLELAARRGIPSLIVDSGAYRREGRADRAAYEAELGRALERLAPDYVCLAGYMLILGEALVQRWAGKMLNIHPSLLPAFPGLHPQQQALQAGALKTGCTVHWVAQAVDGGPTLAQAEVPILPGDTAQSLAQRLLPLEHTTYVKVLKKLAEDDVKQRR